MKKLLIGLLALGSISLFAQNSEDYKVECIKVPGNLCRAYSSYCAGGYSLYVNGIKIRHFWLGNILKAKGSRNGPDVIDVCRSHKLSIESTLDKI